MGFVQSCVLCGDHKRFMHNPNLTGCPGCGSPYCRRCYNSLPKVKVGLIRRQPQCPRCAQGSSAARAPFAPYQGQPMPYPPPPGYGYAPQPSVVVNLPPPPAAPPPPPPSVYLHCRHCGSLNGPGQPRCTTCGAGL